MPAQALLIAMLLALGLAGCASGGTSRAIPVTWRDGPEPWSIELSAPTGPFDTCLQDDAIHEAVQSADLPASHVAATLATGSDSEDVHRILDCLVDSMTGGEITVVGPSDEE
jgi:hypothetical protein